MNTDTRTAWFVEQRDGDTWRPALFWGDKPREKRAGGTSRVFRFAPVPVPVGMHGLCIAELRDRLVFDGTAEAWVFRAHAQGGGA